MDFIQLKRKSDELKKEYKKRFVINQSKTHEIVTIEKSFIDAHILIDFYYKFDAEKDRVNTQYECVFYYDNGRSIYQVIVPYEIASDEYYQENNLIGLHDLNNNEFSLECDNLKLSHKDCNPKKESVKTSIENHIESEMKS